MATVIEINNPKQKKRHHVPRDFVPIDKSSGAGRFFAKMTKEITADLGGSFNTRQVGDWLADKVASS